MNENKFLNNLSDKVTLSPDKKRIEINCAQAQRAYGLFDSKTGKQIGDFIDSKNGQVEFNNLDPNKNYDVGVIENKGDEKPEFAMIWTYPMKDDTDNILNNSDNLPVVYPYIYEITDKGNNSNNVFDIVDDDNKTIGQVENLTQGIDKPRFAYVYSFKMKDDTKQ